MVETVYHRHNRSVDENGLEQEDPLWIVEPSQDGSIYVYAPGSGLGMQRLGYTVKQLAEMAPYASDGHPAVTYTAEKKNTLYTVDASTGHILKSFSSAGSLVNEDRSCRRVNPLESLDDEECEPIGTLTLGRTEYTIGIQDYRTGEQISTIRYFEWGPNNRDQDLTSKYTHSMDRKYVYTKFDGTVLGLENPTAFSKPVYRQKLSSPVARIYDLVRPLDDLSGEASLVVLPQPLGPSPNDFNELDPDYQENVFVNCTPDGSFFALSERNYPTVTGMYAVPCLLRWSLANTLFTPTDGAATAQCYRDSALVPTFSWPMSRKERENFTGLHSLAPPVDFETPGLEPPNRPSIDPPPEVPYEPPIPIPPAVRYDFVSWQALLVMVLVALGTCGAVYGDKLRQIPLFKKQEVVAPQLPPEVDVPPTIEKQTSSTFIEDSPLVREHEPARETIFPHQEPEKAPVVPDPGPNADDTIEKIESHEAADEDEAKDADTRELPEPKKKKATRGKRGGKKQKEKEQQAAEGRTKKASISLPQPAGVISVAASESAQVPGPLQINSLIIHTDKVIGQGSCGTSVFEGSFEGRPVAVKRMLSQYYDLASQEVSFLQQSEDQPNVIKYYCKQEDSHFLYIALQLCQASLFEVWEPEKARTEDRHRQLSGLKFAIQQDVASKLWQLARGLYFLHSLRIIHRDIKPQNILVAFPKPNESNGPRLVISDFGLGKNLPENVSTLVDPTGNAGTSGWKAPELISQPKETESKHSQSQSHNGSENLPNGTTSGVKRAADIFSLGCLFFWVLTDGIHPYEDENGWQQLRELNIKRDNKKMEVLERWSDAYEPMQLITSMLEHQPENRPTALHVLNHPFFWKAEKRLAFLCDCSDHFERQPRGTWDDSYTGDSADLRRLEDRAVEVIGGPSIDKCDFLAKLDRAFVDTLGKQRKYSGYRVLDLLRALRNKKNHYEDMPEDVKKRVGPLSEGYLNFWCNRFPRLLMACHEVVLELGLDDTPRFRGYFVPDTGSL